MSGSPVYDNVMYDIRDRLARIEVKMDTTHETLKAYDVRITANADATADLAGQMAEFKTKVKTFTQIGGAVATVGAVIAWCVDHFSTATAVATSVAH